MAALKITGLDSLRKRLARLGALPGLAPALREEAEAIAEAARASLTGRGDADLARSVEITDLNEGDGPAFAIGTRNPAGRYLEFGTSRMHASPWLSPALFGRSRAINQKLRKVVGEALMAAPKT